MSSLRRFSSTGFNMMRFFVFSYGNMSPVLFELKNAHIIALMPFTLSLRL